MGLGGKRAVWVTLRGGQLITDSGSYLNITFYYTGPTQTGPITSIDGLLLRVDDGNC